MQAHAARAGLPVGPGPVAAQAGQLLPASARRRSSGTAPRPRRRRRRCPGSVSDGSRCQTRLNSQGCGVPSYHWCVPGTPS